MSYKGSSNTIPVGRKKGIQNKNNIDNHLIINTSYKLVINPNRQAAEPGYSLLANPNQPILSTSTPPSTQSISVW